MDGTAVVDTADERRDDGAMISIGLLGRVGSSCLPDFV